ncbi:popeye domain-containing protein 2 [Erinaceus europaeus]|uniref:Popeye domain-containing protein 2 n=1 Tax=Erinaceus europaeus TaxID=9365 RepID=A0A1S3AAX5_ERIEU|nr:popeye domain-containing protein 2 [Erinaceus europaeus]XP_060054292.1 popeye domain-containing protein 2 [Erinaceus europaeus]XP_060054293.1 popeye domain-containing protein 2 [Erinaceus europaeus]XP_060054294.1 popeye domain-containing protein 2 [Erinaceus europaeus]
MSANSSTVGQLLLQGPVCIGWKQEMEGSLYHLANCILLLGFMGGSGVFGCFYVFGFLGTGFLCCVLWGWFHACGLDIILWNFLLAVACLLQLGHLVYLLRKDTLPEEFRSLYRTLYLPLQVPLQAYKEIVHCCKEQVLTLVTEQTYAVEGETPINRLSLLLSGRVRVSQDGQFLHYIFPYQFMDSPEWESLQPSEEGIFQVTLTAETECSYVSWPRKSLYHLLTRERYISQLFSALLGYDISEKLYAVNDKLFAKFGLRFDIRLPRLYHVLGPVHPDVGPESEKEDEETHEHAMLPPQAMPNFIQEKTPCSPPRSTTDPPIPSCCVRTPRPDSGVLGEDSTSLVLEDFEELSGSESVMDYRSDGEYMR